MKPVDEKSNTYIDSSKETNNKDTTRKIGDIVRISKYKNSFAKDCTPNWSEEVFVIKKLKNTLSRTYAIKNFNDKEFVGTFYEKESQKPDQQYFRIEKVKM